MTLPVNVVVPLAPGFEELEAVAVIDVLRRADLNVVIAGLVPGPITGSHGITIATDTTIDRVDPAAVHVLVLPGGMPGTQHLMESETVLELVRTLNAGGRPVAAICAAPMVLAAAGIVDGLPVTSHPSVRDRLGRADVREWPRVVRAGNVLTSQGPGTAVEFALELVRGLVGPAKSAELRAAMVAPQPETARA